MLKVCYAGLPLSAVEILSKACGMIYGENNIEFEEIPKGILRTNVRVYTRIASCVMIVLDKVSMNESAAAIGPVTPEKVIEYTSDANLVGYLNSKYNINLELPTVEEDESVLSVGTMNSDDSAMVEQLKAQLQDKEGVINNLYAQIKELREIYESEDGYDDDFVKQSDYDDLKESYENLQSENLSLRGSVSNLENNLAAAENDKENAERSVKEQETKIHLLSKKLSKLETDYKTVSDDLTNARLNYTNQVSLVRAQKDEIEELKEQVGTVEELETDLAKAKEDLSNVSKELQDRVSELKDLKIQINSKDEDISRLSEEVAKYGKTDELLESTKKRLDTVQAERDKLQKDLDSMSDECDQLADSYSESEDRVSELEKKVESLKTENQEYRDRLDQQDKDILSLNSDKIRLTDELNAVKSNMEDDSDVRDMVDELANLRMKLDTLNGSIFTKIAGCALPKSSMSVDLLRNKMNLENITFVFSGSVESRKGTYKCLFEECKKLPKLSKVLIVDAVSETAVDYVFQISRVVNGIDWFQRGGSVIPFLSKTCLDNVSVLSAGVGYVNDSYLLDVCWESRLRELNNSGYKVFVYCGDVSNMVGRIMHESFSGCASCVIYVQGNILGSRAVIANMSGLGCASSSIVRYFDFIPDAERFAKVLKDKIGCKCEIISRITPVRSRR